MKKLVLFILIARLLTSCKTFEKKVIENGNYVKTYDDGYVVEFIGVNPNELSDSTNEYEIQPSDSVVFYNDTFTVIQDLRYIYLNRNREIIGYESRP